MPGPGHLGPGEQRDRDRQQQRHHARGSAPPWRRSPTIRPNVHAIANGISRSRKISKQVGERRRVLERVRGVGVVEAAAVGAELLDRLLAGHRAAGEVLAAAGQRVHRPGGSSEVLDDAEERPARTAATSEIGSSTRTTVRTRSAQKLPTRPSLSVAREAAGEGRGDGHADRRRETKFCTVSPDICIRWPVAASPEYHCQFVLVTNETAVFQAPSVGQRREAERERQVLLEPAEAEEHAGCRPARSRAPTWRSVRQCWSASGSTRSTRYDDALDGEVLARWCRRGRGSGPGAAPSGPAAATRTAIWPKAGSTSLIRVSSSRSDPARRRGGRAPRTPPASPRRRGHQSCLPPKGRARAGPALLDAFLTPRTRKLTTPLRCCGTRRTGLAQPHDSRMPAGPARW